MHIYERYVMHSSLGLLLMAMLLWTPPVRSQVVNVQPLMAARDEGDGLKSEVTASLDVRTWNFDFLMASAALLMRYTHGRHRLIWSSNAEMGYKGGFEDADRFILRGFTHLRYQIDVQDWLVWEAYVQGAGDELRRTKHRILAGTGPRFDFYDDEMWDFSLGVSYMFERVAEDWDVVEVDPITDEATTSIDTRGEVNQRVSVYLPGTVKIDDQFTIVHTTYFQPNFTPSPGVDMVIGDFRLSTQTRLGVKLTDLLGISVGFGLSYDSTPPTPVKALDISTNLGLNITF